MTENVWSTVIGQPDAVATLTAAAQAAAMIVEGATPASGAMTHAWLFTGPPGSGQATVAQAFAAALQCVKPDGPPGCGECAGCHTTLAGTHADVRFVVPEGLSISVADMRALVQSAARMPTNGRWQIVVIADADRLTEGASNALLKSIEEPPARTVFLLCSPSDHPDDIATTIRSRCRIVALGTPTPTAIADLLTRQGIQPDQALWAASASSGDIRKAHLLATDQQARARRETVLSIPMSLNRISDVFSCADELIKAIEADASAINASRDESERTALETAMGAGGTGKGTATASRGAKGVLKDLEKRQKSRNTRAHRDSYDMALADLAAFYRDVLTVSFGAQARLNHPDREHDSRKAAQTWSQESTLRRLETVLKCREALRLNVKPRIAIEAMLTNLHQG